MLQEVWDWALAASILSLRDNKEKKKGALIDDDGEQSQIQSVNIIRSTLGTVS